MAYIKYKELTKYFNFNKEIPKENLPQYVLDYTEDKEKIFKAYKTFRDKAIFTDRRMILFDVNLSQSVKKIHIIPYSSISTAAVQFKAKKAAILISFDSGYQMKLNFVKMDAAAKTELRKLYVMIMNKVLELKKPN